MTIRQLCKQVKPDTIINIENEGTAEASSILKSIYLYNANRSILRLDLINNIFYITVSQE